MSGEPAARALPDLSTLLAMEPERGRITLGRERMVLLSADALGSLRRELHETLGPALAAEVLFRFGRRCGREEARRVRTDLGVEEAGRALAMGPLLHAFTGIARVRVEEPVFARDGPRLAGAWEDSYEAEQHLRLFGPSPGGVCWTLAGYASGFAGEVLQRDLLCREIACIAAGAPECRWAVVPADPLHAADLPEHLRSSYAALEERLRRQDSMLESLREATGEGLYTIDNDGFVTSWDAGVMRLLGLGVESALGRHEREFFPADLVRRGDDRKLARACATSPGAVRTPRTVRIACDGREVGVDELRTALRDEGGRTIGATVLLRPAGTVSSPAAELTLRTLLESVPEGIALTTPDQRVVECNDEFRRMVGLDADRPLGGVTCHSLLAGSGLPCEDCPSAQVFDRGSTVRCHPTLPRSDGSRVHFELRSFPLRDADGRVTHELKVVRDVTEERERERELEERRRLASLGEMAARLAHEVKNPLAGMRGALQILGRRRTEDDPEKEVFVELIAHIDRLDDTVKDLLSFARPQVLRRERTQPRDVLEAAVRLVGASPELAEVSLRCVDGGAPEIPLDRQQVIQVVTNLVLNAVQALRPGDDRTITLTASPGSEGGAVLEVRDRGPGIPEGERARLFRPFHTTKPRGTGLGLAICRKIAEAHGGSLEFDSPADGGAAFRLHLPA